MSARSRPWIARAFVALATLAASSCESEDAPGKVRSVSADPDRSARDGGADSGTGSGGLVIPRSPGTRGGGAPPKEPLMDLDEAEAMALCEELDARFSARIEPDRAARFVCSVYGLLEAVALDADDEPVLDRAVCESRFASCISLGLRPGAVDCERITDGLRGCELGSSDLLACYDAEIARVSAALEMVSCSLETVEQVDSLLSSLVASSLPECEEVADECPELLPPAGPETVGVPAFDGCSDTCESASDRVCDDGGEGSEAATCVFGSDCGDCGPR